ncbi:SRPBCC family protein [Micromonospora chalcea]|uniref:SRPBCC family protein n=1 Tax=Micromonospora chalcea TaxID=1874 RepID=UPI001FC9EACF|nr:SRPBCC family protein [Micromonospora chalcea]
MKITNEFTVDIPIAQAWAILTDLEGVAPCLPGAQLTGVDGDVHQGTVKVKVGPVVSEFAGTARFVEKDEERYRGVIEAKGRDRRSAANASALVTAHLRPVGQRTVVSVDTDLKISGRLAQFGSGMIKEVSGKLLAQFVANLEARLAAEETGDPHAATAPDASEPAPAVAATPDRASPPRPGPTPPRPCPVPSRPTRTPPRPGPPWPAPPWPSRRPPVDRMPTPTPNRRRWTCSTSPVGPSSSASCRCSSGSSSSVG